MSSELLKKSKSLRDIVAMRVALRTSLQNGTDGESSASHLVPIGRRPLNVQPPDEAIRPVCISAGSDLDRTLDCLESGNYADAQVY